MGVILKGRTEEEVCPRKEGEPGMGEIREVMRGSKRWDGPLC